MKLHKNQKSITTINVKETTINVKELNKAISKIGSGRALLFSGAGFSVGTKNVNGEQPLMAKELSIEISKLGGFEKDEDLSYVSDYYLSKKEKEPLIELLKRNYTITKTSQSHIKLCGLKWRRIYTTNYDNSIEFSSQKAGKIVKSLTLQDNPSDYFKNNEVCLHINGTIEHLDEITLDSSFKLTRSSYVSPDSFTNSTWYYPFKKDIEQCSAIIFVGYSMYDIDIEKLLFASPEFKTKTYFIIRENPTEKEIFTLSKYGVVFPIGIDNFSKELDNKISFSIESKSELWLDCFAQYKISDAERDISDDEILKFILNGDIENCFIDNALTGTQKKPYIVLREKIDEIYDNAFNQKNIVIYSDFGNGKSIVLKQLMSSLTLLGKQVFYIENDGGNGIGDIDKIQSLENKSILIIDGYANKKDLLSYINTINSKKITLIIAERTHKHETNRNFLFETNFDPLEYNIDIMSDKECQEIVDIIDNIGYWGKNVFWSSNRKLNYIITKNKRQLSHTLLNIFDSPQIKDRISKLLNSIIINPAYYKIVFAICLIEVLDLPVEPSLISEISGNNEIYKSKLRQDISFNQLFSIKKHKIISKSSLFSIHLLRNHFNPSYITNTLLDLASKYEQLQYAGQTEKELFKSLLRFTFIERILPDQNKRNSLVKYYEELKVRIYWLKSDPHYWLQYGMARITFKEYDKSQSYFEQAYALAESRGEYYDTSYIDTQQARLYMLLSLDETDGNIIFDFFKRANNLLIPLENNIYKFRQVLTYKKFYDEKFHLLSKKNRPVFIQACKKMKSDLESELSFWHTHSYGNSVQYSCFDGLNKIIEAEET